MESVDACEKQRMGVKNFQTHKLLFESEISIVIALSSSIVICLVPKRELVSMIMSKKR
jgi:hypothetical protein